MGWVMKKVPDHLSWRDLPHEVTLPKHSHDRLRQSEPVPPKRTFGYPSEVVEDLLARPFRFPSHGCSTDPRTPIPLNYYRPFGRFLAVPLTGPQSHRNNFLKDQEFPAPDWRPGERDAGGSSRRGARCGASLRTHGAPLPIVVAAPWGNNHERRRNKAYGVHELENGTTRRQKP